MPEASSGGKTHRGRIPRHLRDALVHGTPTKDGDFIHTRLDMRVGRSSTGPGALREGIVIDAGGADMILRRDAGAGARTSRYYVSSAVNPLLGTLQQIPASRLESSVLASMKRIGLGDNWPELDEPQSVLKRVVILEDEIVLQLTKRICLASWRAQEPMLQRLSTADVLRLVNTCLSRGEEITEAGTTLCLRIPRHARARKTFSRTNRPSLLFQHRA